ncbi:MAG TPA: lactonase family protein [Vicinamibacteria bacterium]
MTETLATLVRPALLLALGVAALSAVAAPAPKPMAVYVGTYTDGTSRGIYRTTFDPSTGSLTEPVLAAETKNPSFLALHPSGRFLYAVGEISSFEGAKTGAVSAFAVDPRTGDLALLNQQASEGTGPCHLVVDKAGKNVLVANYGGGTVAVLPIEASGRLKKASSVRAHEGSGPTKGRQEKPHAHGIYLDAAERFAFSPDLGADRVFVYRFDGDRGTLEPHGAAPVDPGSGPRHLAFHPSGRFAYAINELLSTVTAFSYEAEKGALAPIQTITTLPAGFSGTSWTAEVEVSRDGRFLYGSNRGDDSLAVFAVDSSTGRLAAKGHAPVGGKYPRHFTIEPSGRFILAGHQNSGTISVLRLDPATGMPALTGVTVKLDKPVCLLPVAGR